MIYLVCLAGIVAGFYYRDKAPRAFLLVIASSALLLAVALLAPWLEWAIYKAFGASAGGGLTVSRLLQVSRWGTGLLQAVGVAGLIASSFLDRGLAFPPRVGGN